MQNNNQNQSHTRPSLGQLKVERTEINKTLEESDKAYQTETSKFRQYNFSLDTLQIAYIRSLFGNAESMNIAREGLAIKVVKIGDEINKLSKDDPKKGIKEMQLEQKRRDTEKEFTDNLGLAFQNPIILTNQQRADYNTLLALRNNSLRACNDATEKHLLNVTKLVECSEKIAALENSETTSTEDIDASSDMPSYTNPED